MEALIPGLPHEVAEECLLRVSYTHLTLLGSVCQQWRRLVHSPDFHRRRRLAGISRPLLAITQYSPSTSTGINQLTIFDPSSDKWYCLPPRPIDIPTPWIYNPRVAGLGHYVLAMNWCNGTSYVHTCNLLTGRWRIRAPMPGPPRSGFSCLSDGVRRVLITGGETKIFLSSGIIFDLEKDAWGALPDLTDGRVQLELLTLSSRYWSILDLMGCLSYLPPSFLSTIALKGKVFGCQGSTLSVTNGSTWKQLLDLPREINGWAYITVSRRGLLVICSATWSGHLQVYTLILKGDSKSLSWRAHTIPRKYNGGCLYETCWLEL